MKFSKTELKVLTVAARAGRSVVGGDMSARESTALNVALRKLRQEIKVIKAKERMPEAAAELRKELDRLWREAGEPSVRQMARDMGMSHMTWHGALRCTPVPSWETFSRLVRYLDENPHGELEGLWLRAKGRTISN